MQEKLRVGTIVTTHGLKGEVKVYPTTEDPDRFFDLKKVWLDLSGSGDFSKAVQLTIESVRFQKNMVLVKFEGYDDVEQMMPFRKKDLYVDRKDAIPLKEGEYFQGDFIGCRVILEDDSVLGEVTGVMETGANSVFVVKTDKKDVLIPYIPPVVLEAKPEEGYLRVHLLPGLLDL